MATRLEEALVPALDAYGAELEAHQRDWTTEWPSCRCGYTRSARSVGMHVAAAHRRADKVYAEAAAQVVAELVAPKVTA